MSRSIRLATAAAAALDKQSVAEIHCDEVNALPATPRSRKKSRTDRTPPYQAIAIRNVSPDRGCADSIAYNQGSAASTNIISNTGTGKRLLPFALESVRMPMLDSV